MENSIENILQQIIDKNIVQNVTFEEYNSIIKNNNFSIR